MALFRGEDSELARAGALLLADALDCLRDLRAFVRGLAAGGKRRG